MSTAAVQKNTATTTWSVTKIQEQVSNALTAQMFATIKVLELAGPEVISKVRHEWAKLKVENFRAQGVKTPLDLVTAWTEYETNMFGSKLRYWGDDKQAHVEYEECGCWSALERMNISEPAMESMSNCYAEMTHLLAKEFGFTGTEKIGSGPNEAPCTITFTKV